MLNSVGLQGPGVEHWIEHELPELRARGARVIASLWGRTVDDFAVAAKMLAARRRRTSSRSRSTSAARTSRTGRGCSRTRRRAPPPWCTRCVDAELGLPLFAKLSPNTFEIVDVARCRARRRRDRADAREHAARPPASTPTRAGRASARAAGDSPARRIKPVALRAVHDVARALPGRPDHRHRRSDAPARTRSRCCWPARPRSGVGTATFREPRAMLRILDELETWCRRRTASTARRRPRSARTGGEDRMITTEVPAEVRDRLVLGLDVGDLDEARGDRDAGSRRGSGSRRSATSSTRRPARGVRPDARARLPRLLRPQAPRHPEHGRAGARARTRATASSS